MYADEKFSWFWPPAFDPEADLLAQLGFQVTEFDV